MLPEAATCSHILMMPQDNRVFLAVQAFCMIFNIARLVISSITKVNCGDSVIVLSIFVVGIVCIEKMIKVCDRE